MEIERRIVSFRGLRVMLDADLAAIYGVQTRELNQAVQRNIERFPADFMFQLTASEAAVLRSQFVISKRRGGRRYLPFAFTEHGAVMLAAILKSPLAVEASIQIARAFVRLRRVLKEHAQLSAKIDELERRLEGHDTDIGRLFEAIRRLMEPAADPEPGPPIGFQPP